MTDQDKGIPSGFKPLDPEFARKAIEGYEDELWPESVKLEALYRQHRECPRGCGPTMQKHMDMAFAFSHPDYLIPRALMKCTHCGCLLNPFDGMIVELGDPDTANAGGTVIKPEE